MRNKNLMLMILMFGILVGVTTLISAQITGNTLTEPDGTRCGYFRGPPCSSEAKSISTNADGTRCGYAGGPSCDNLEIENAGTSTTGTKTSSSAKARKSSGVPKRFEAVNREGGGKCFVKESGKAMTGSFLGGLFDRTYSGDVVVTGEMTQAECDGYCGTGDYPSTGTLSSSGGTCSCSAINIERNGQYYCANVKGAEICGKLGKSATMNTGDKVTFMRDKGSRMMTMSIKQSVRQLPKYS